MANILYIFLLYLYTTLAIVAIVLNGLISRRKWMKKKSFQMNLIAPALFTTSNRNSKDHYFNCLLMLLLYISYCYSSSSSVCRLKYMRLRPTNSSQLLWIPACARRDGDLEPNDSILGQSQ